VSFWHHHERSSVPPAFRVTVTSTELARSSEIATEDDRNIVLEHTGRKTNKLDEGASRRGQVRPTRDAGDVLLLPITQQSIGGDDQRRVA
jgi:hypothetical protein